MEMGSQEYSRTYKKVANKINIKFVDYVRAFYKGKQH